MLHVFVGYDPREHEAYEVCRHSILRHSNEPTVVTPLKLPSLCASGLYTRQCNWNEDRTQRFDVLDGKPFSTDFSFSRFLVPEIARRNGLTGWVMFVDCDFMFFDGVEWLFDGVEGQEADIAVVKHNYVPAHARKMDNQIQEPYNRKLWSSLMLFNVHSSACRRLTPELVNSASGAYLHGLQWVDDDRIGTLSELWNWIPGVSPTTGNVPNASVRAVHWTEGGPCLPGYENVLFAPEYAKELALVHASRFSWDKAVKL